MRQVLLGAAHFACAVRPSCRFAHGRLAPFTFVLLTDAGLSLLAQSLHSKAYFYRLVVRLSVLLFFRGVGFFSSVPFVLHYRV